MEKFPTGGFRAAKVLVDEYLREDVLMSVWCCWQTVIAGGFEGSVMAKATICATSVLFNLLIFDILKLILSARDLARGR